MTPRILLVEDHPLVRDGLRMLLEQAGMEICGEAENRAEALATLAATGPDLLMVDLSLGGESGLDLIRQLPDGAAPVLVYSMHEDWLHVRLAFQAGARGYVTKREIADILMEAIQTVLDGQIYTSPRAARAISETAPIVRLEGLEEFSGQEKEIMYLLGQGLGVGEVAQAMEISRKTAESYCGRMQVKLNLQGMKELRHLALNTVRTGHGTPEKPQKNK